MPRFVPDQKTDLKTAPITALKTGLKTSLKAARELGLKPSLLFLIYRLGVRSGWYRLVVQPPKSGENLQARPLPFTAAPVCPDLLREISPEKIAAILAGEVEIFGALREKLDFSVTGLLEHWTRHEAAAISGPPKHWMINEGAISGPPENQMMYKGVLSGGDIKFLWEPARFGWAAQLAAAYHSTGDERIPAFLAETLANFMRLNPPYCGPHWANGQEVALRLLHLAMAFGAFAEAMPGFGDVLAAHAARIPPTLVYARAQNNNHLLSETAALYTAGLTLPDHPRADRWRKLGWDGFTAALLDQFDADGAYMQQSTNYHRLALTLALWMQAAAESAGASLPPASLDRLAAGTLWLLARCDPESGAVPNLGPNDGAHILPLSSRPFADYRPVLQARRPRGTRRCPHRRDRASRTRCRSRRSAWRPRWTRTMRGSRRRPGTRPGRPNPAWR